MVLGALMFNAGMISDTQYTLLGRLRKLVSDAERASIETISPDSAESSDAGQFVAPHVRNTGHARIRSVSPVFAKSARPRPGSPADCGTSL